MIFTTLSRAIARATDEWKAVCRGCAQRLPIWCEGDDGECYCKSCGEALYRA